MLPAAGTPAARTGPLPGRRRLAVTVAVLCAGAPLVAAASVEAGGSAVIDRGLDEAAGLAASGDLTHAIAAYRDVAARGGPVYLLARSRIEGAGTAAARTELDWARDLAAHGEVDAALAVAGAITDASLVDRARRERAEIALAAAAAAHAAGHDADALHRLDQVGEDSPPADLLATARRLRPGYAVGAARALLLAGQAYAAVTALDDAIRSAGGAQDVVAAARALLPRALLGAGQERAGRGDPGGATALLQRCIDEYGRSPEAAQARRLLAAPQTVTGTLTRRDGSPVAGTLVRLSGGYRRVGSSFMVGGPFFTARTDGRGDFRVDGVPIGVPLVFEFFDNGDWVLIVDQNHVPAYPVDVQPLTPVDLAYVREP